MASASDNVSRWGGEGSRWCSAIALVAALSGCAVDARELEKEGIPQAGSDSGPSAGAAGESSTGGSVGEPPPPEDIPVCSFAGRTVMGGCETLAANPGFDSSTNGWQEEPIAMQVSWSQDDAEQNSSSGSIVVTNALNGATEGVALGAGMQCLPAKAGTTYVMAGDVFIPEHQDEGLMDGGPYVGRAGIGLLFWRGKGCSDTMPTLGGAQTELIDTTGKWVHVDGSAVAPDGIESMSVRVLTAKDFREFRFKAMFDNVLVQARPATK